MSNKKKSAYQSINHSISSSNQASNQSINQSIGTHCCSLADLVCISLCYAYCQGHVDNKRIHKKNPYAMWFSPNIAPRRNLRWDVIYVGAISDSSNTQLLILRLGMHYYERHSNDPACHSKRYSILQLYGQE